MRWLIGFSLDAAPHPDACRRAVKTIDEALLLLAEVLGEEFRLERRGL